MGDVDEENLKVREGVENQGKKIREDMKTEVKDAVKGMEGTKEEVKKMKGKLEADEAWMQVLEAEVTGRLNTAEEIIQWQERG